MLTTLRNFALQVLIVLCVYALPLFLPAGIQAWPAAWIFLILWFGFWGSIFLWLSRHNPPLFHERLRVSAPDQKGWDRIFGMLINLVLFGWLLFIAFDVTRWHWSPVPAWLQMAGGAIVLFSFYIFYRTFRENTFLSPLVRIQGERGQTVISSGPYHYVRHPMYAATTVFILGAPLLLGAWLGLLPGLLFVLVLARRAVLEEATLRRELPGYAAYKDEVKYRLVPFICN